MVEPKMEAAGIEPAISVSPDLSILRGFMCSPHVGHRLAALADGEGCFIIQGRNKQKSVTTWNCSFVVKMRADDRPFLERMARETGLGRLYTIKETRADGHNRQNQAAWVIDTKAAALELVAIFDRYPLWSKKVRDYEVWRQAVIYWNSVKRGGKGIDWAPMEQWGKEIQEVRKFSAQGATPDSPICRRKDGCIGCGRPSRCFWTLPRKASKGIESASAPILTEGDLARVESYIHEGYPTGATWKDALHEIAAKAREMHRLYPFTKTSSSALRRGAA